MAVVNLVEVDNPDDSVAEEPLAEQKPEGVEALGLGVSEATAAALDGTLNPEYIPAYYENKRLKPKHMKILRMAVAGYSNKQIAAHMDYTPARVSIILNHQDSRAIMARMVGEAANRLGVSERLQAVAPEMLEHVISITRTTHDNKLRSKNAFELLDRAGYGATKQVEVNDKRQALVSSDALTRLSAVLQESNALLTSQYDPAKRSLSRAAQAMIAGEAVEVAGSSPSLAPAAGGDTSQRDVPPDVEPQQPSAVASVHV